MLKTDPIPTRPFFAKIRQGVALSVIALAALSFSSSNALATKKIVIGTGSEAGIYIVLGKAICKAIKLHTTEIACSVVPSAGSVDNVKGLLDGRFDIAIVQSDVHHHAVKGQGMFSGAGPNGDIRSLFSAYQEALTVVAHADTKINGLEDLPGKRINIGPDGSGSNTTMKMLSATAQWEYSAFDKVATLPPKAQASSFCKKELDVLTFVAGQPNALIASVLKKCRQSHLVNISGPAVDALTKSYPYYTKAIIPKEAYPGIHHDVKSVGMLATVVTTTRLSDTLAYEVAQAVFDNFTSIMTFHKVFRYMSRNEMVHRGLTAPLHTGARRYLHETARVK